MIKIYIFADSYKHLDIGIKEYEKRLGRDIKVIKIKPVKNGDIIEKETDILVDLLEKENGFKIVLNPNGEDLSTENFYDLIENKKQVNKNIIFIIGGANGINYSKIKKLIDCELSFGKMIMSHILILLVLIEQIYRIYMIKKGTSYHK